MTLPTKIKRILLSPDPRLTAPNADVVESWDELELWVRRMWKIIHADSWCKGVGLAAPQVGWNVRLFILNLDIRSNDPRERRVYWNPRIIRLAGDPVPTKEGCLSLPHVWAQVPRYPEVTFEAMTPVGQVFRTFKGLDAQAVQHEMDHLAGRLAVLDHLNDPLPLAGAGEGAPMPTPTSDTLPPPAVDLAQGLRP